MSFDDQERQARMTNTEDSMPLMSMSEKQWQITKQQGIAQSKIMEGMGGTSTDYQQSLSGLSASADNLKAALGAPLLTPLTLFTNGLSDATNRLAKIAAGQDDPTMTGNALNKGLVAGLQGGLSSAGGPFATIANQLAFTSAAGSAGDAYVKAKDDALKKNTDSHDRNTAATTKLGSALQGTFGVQDTTGRRAGAFPEAIGPQNPLARADFFAHGRQLGAF